MTLATPVHIDIMLKIPEGKRKILVGDTIQTVLIPAKYFAILLPKLRFYDQNKTEYLVKLYFDTKKIIE